MRAAVAALVLGCAVMLWAGPEKQAGPAVHVRVRVQNYASVPAGELQAAENQVRQIFGHAGIATEWLECNPGAAVADARCEQRLGPDEFTLSILPAEMSRRFKQRDSVFGYSLPCDREAPTCYGYVFFDRIAAMRDQTISHSTLMGYVAAHELGHMLLHDMGHARAGLMIGRWDDAQLQSAARGGLLLLDSQADKIREDLLVRDAEAEAQQTAAGSR